MQQDNNIPEDIKEWIMKACTSSVLSTGDPLYSKGRKDGVFMGCVLMYWKMQEIDDDEKEELKQRLIIAEEKISSLAAQIKEYREAIEWYADHGNYCHDMGNNLATAWQAGNISNKAKIIINKYPQ